MTGDVPSHRFDCNSKPKFLGGMDEWVGHARIIEQLRTIRHHPIFLTCEVYLWHFGRVCGPLITS